MRLHKLLGEALLHNLIEKYIEKYPDTLEFLKQLTYIKPEEEHNHLITSHEFYDFQVQCLMKLKHQIQTWPSSGFFMSMT